MTDEQIAKKLREGVSASQLYVLNKINPSRCTEIRKRFNIPAVKQSWRGDVTKA